MNKPIKTADDFLSEPSLNDCLMTIMPYLVWAADINDISGGVNANDALESFRVVLGWDTERFNALCDVFRM